MPDTTSNIPDYQSIMLPLLELAGDGVTYRLRDAVDLLAQRFALSQAELKEMLPSGYAPLFANRVGWASTYLKKAGLLESEKRGTFQISERGRSILNAKPERIDVAFLDQFPEFVAFRKGKRKTTKTDSEASDTSKEVDVDQNPEEQLEFAHQKLQEELAQELLQAVLDASPQFFEQLVVDLLLAMGYGGTRADAGRAIGRSNDGGVDGIIKEDRLGLDIIYIQAKRWENTVPVREVRDFAGALLGKKARKGVFITTSSYPKSAYEYIQSIEPKIILIDGEQLGQFMIEHKVGVAPHKVFEVKRVDLDYFEG